MAAKRRLLAVSVVIIAGAAALWLSNSTVGSTKTYEIHPEITLPEYKTDTRYSIEAYERMMNRLMDLNERNFGGVRSEVKSLDRKLDLIDLKLTNLSERVARIEKILAPQPAEEPIGEETAPQETDKPTSYESPALRSQ